MPVLNWIGKDKVVNHHLDVPYHVLDRQYSYDKDGEHKEDNGSENMIIHGDNLLALKSLLPRYEGKIKCIYIDPPYNTGNEEWVYNDNVNDPHIRAWLGKVVGGELDDLSRHDKWLCMMYPRIQLLRKLLKNDGVIFISIDDNEQANLIEMCNEIFDKTNFITSIPWQSRTSMSNDTDICINHEYIVAYAKNRRKVDRRLKAINQDRWYKIDEFAFNPVAINNEKFSNPNHDERGAWKADPMDAPHIRPNLTYSIVNPNTHVEYLPPKGRCWRISQEKYEVAFADNRIYFGKDGKGKPQLKSFLSEKENFGSVTNTWFEAKTYGTTTKATKELQDIFGEKGKIFDTPKPIELLENLIQLSTSENSIILDAFAGSGTTAHAVLDLNKSTGSNRKFILIEMMDYANTLTANRAKLVISGYAKNTEDILYDKEITTKNLKDGEMIIEEANKIVEEAKNSNLYSSVKKPNIEGSHLYVKSVTKAKDQAPGTGGDFSYYELGDTLMKDDVLNEAISTEKIREYIFFTETKQVLSNSSEDEPYLLGVYANNAYYFYYEKRSVTTLDRDFLHTIKTETDGYVIFADICLLSDRELKKHNITFKKIPRDITKF